MTLKPLKTVSGVISQFQAGDSIDPQFVPMIITSVPVSFSASQFTGSTPESLLTLTPCKNYVNGTPGTSFQATSGKTLVLAGMSSSFFDAGGAGNVCGGVYRLRVNPTGAVTVTSPLVSLMGGGVPTLTKNVIDGNFVPLSTPPFVISISGTQSLGVTQEGNGANQNFLLWGFEY